MKPRATGSGQTPEFIIRILKDLVLKDSLSGVASGIGVSSSMIHRYLKGIGEPTISTLQKISNYTGRTFKFHIKPYWKNK